MDQTKTPPKVVVKDVGSHGGFQSKEALEATKVVEEPEDSSAEPESALVLDTREMRPDRMAAARVMADDGMQMVKVRSKTFIPPFRYGPKMYSLQANKEMLLPKAVKRHLEEKGLL